MCLLKLYSFIIFSTIISSVAPMFKPPSETECTNHTLKSALELTIWWARKNNKQTIKMQCYKCLSGREKHRALLEYRRGVDWRSKSLGFCLWVCFGVCEDSRVRTAPPIPRFPLWNALVAETDAGVGRRGRLGGCGAPSPGKSHNRQGCSAPGEPDLKWCMCKRGCVSRGGNEKSLKSFNPGSAIRCFGCQQHPVAKCEGWFGGWRTKIRGNRHEALAVTWWTMLCIWTGNEGREVGPSSRASNEQN